MKPDQPFKKGIGFLGISITPLKTASWNPFKWTFDGIHYMVLLLRRVDFHVPGIGFLGGEYQQWILGTWKITKNMESEANR